MQHHLKEQQDHLQSVREQTNKELLAHQEQIEKQCSEREAVIQQKEQYLQREMANLEEAKRKLKQQKQITLME